jgi:hypothetical protein
MGMKRVQYIFLNAQELWLKTEITSDSKIQMGRQASRRATQWGNQGADDDDDDCDEDDGDG